MRSFWETQLKLMFSGSVIAATAKEVEPLGNLVCPCGVANLVGPSSDDPEMTCSFFTVPAPGMASIDAPASVASWLVRQYPLDADQRAEFEKKARAAHNGRSG